MINLESRFEEDIYSFINLFQTIIMKNLNQFYFIQMITIIMFTLHRTLGLLPRSSPSTSKNPQLQFDLILQILIIIIEQCLEAIQLPLSMMIIDEQHILPILYLTFAYLDHILKYKNDLFEHKNESSGSLFIRYSDYPLAEERALECFTPLNDILKSTD
ncbi:unnamed protein product [Adineta steineri]|uniref:Uncharacterized protein n=1 Tax=Adineta steineri TaxID=433720 RepID=A0A813QA50_9BILA|nr:unnamed protein product [Adineta steineri]